MADPLLSVENLAVERGGRLVLSDLSFSLDRGEICLATGPNGAGKSTLLRTVAGLVPKVGGKIRFELADEDTRGVETLHYLGYEDALKPSLSVRENLVFWGAMLTTPGSGTTSVTVPDALARFGIARLVDLPAAYLSAGQKRRVALARLLLASRPIWLLDEPFIALDAGAQRILIDEMRAHLRTGGTILMASHQPIDLPFREIALGREALQTA